MDLANIINSEKIKLDKEYTEKLMNEEIVFQKECEKYKPVIDVINDGLKKAGLQNELKAVLHTNKRHYPCPAIHIQGKSRGLIYSEFSEICLSSEKYKWRSGGCNMLNNKHKDDNDLIEFIGKTIAKKVFSRKRID